MSIEAITAANVIPSALARFVMNADGTRTRATNVAFAAGTFAYKLVDGTYGTASATGSTPAHRPVGMFVNSGGASQPCDIVWYDPALEVSTSSFDVAQVYILGTSGGLFPATDATTGWQTSIVATGLTTTTICLHCPMGAPTPLTNPTPAHA